MFLLTTLEETHQENETYGKIILDKNEILEGLETKRMAMEGEIKTKELIEKKYILAMEEIGRLEKVRNSNINRIIEWMIDHIYLHVIINDFKASVGSFIVLK